jgi:hypothetical protein
MVNEQRIDIAACVGTDALLGKIMGDSHFPLLLGAILKNPPGSVIYLDFSRITNITASYIAATIGRLLRMIPSGSLDRFIVIGGISQDYQDEIAYVLEHEHTPILQHTTDGKLRILGPLDNAYAQTLQAVTARGRVTAKELQATTNEKIGHTGWIKRLTTLHLLGLVKRNKTGREYAYEPITMEQPQWVKTS